MPCNRVRRFVFLWVDRDREDRLRDPVARHLDECPDCRERAVAVEQMILLVRTRCRRQCAPNGLGERIRSLIESE